MNVHIKSIKGIISGKEKLRGKSLISWKAVLQDQQQFQASIE